MIESTVFCLRRELRFLETCRDVKDLVVKFLPRDLFLHSRPLIQRNYIQPCNPWVQIIDVIEGFGSSLFGWKTGFDNLHARTREFVLGFWWWNVLVRYEKYQRSALSFKDFRTIYFPYLLRSASEVLFVICYFLFDTIQSECRPDIGVNNNAPSNRTGYTPKYFHFRLFWLSLRFAAVPVVLSFL